MSTIDSAKQLALYNQALTMCGERILASLTENREPRRLLDQAWNDGMTDALLFCLEQGQWDWAIRSQAYTYSPSVQPNFGYQYAFNKPDDWVRTTAVCTDAYYNVPLTQYEDEGGFWYADWQTIYVKWVSKDPAFGLNTALWTQAFIDFVAAYLAQKVCYRLTEDKQKREEIKAYYKKCRTEARSLNMSNNPTKFMPQGAWAGARYGRYGRGMRGNGGSGDC